MNKLDYELWLMIRSGWASDDSIMHDQTIF